MLCGIQLAINWADKPAMRGNGEGGKLHKQCELAEYINKNSERVINGIDKEGRGVAYGLSLHF